MYLWIQLLFQTVKVHMAASKVHQFKFDGNNGYPYIYLWPCSLINWQNIKDDKRNVKMWKLINPQEKPSWLHHVPISNAQKKKELLPPPCTVLSVHLHLGQINYLPSIKGTIIFQPPSYANESTEWWDGKLVTKWSWQKNLRGRRVEL